MSPRTSASRFAFATRTPWAACLLAALFVAVPSFAEAQWRPDGALSGQMLIRDGSFRDACDSGTTSIEGSECTELGLGAGLQLDLFSRFGVLSVGPSTGIYALGGADDDTRVFMPLAAAFAVSTSAAPVGAHLVVRPGVWFGGTNAGLRGGLYVSGGAHVLIRLDDRTRLAAGLDVTALFGPRRAVLYAPTIGIHWTLQPAPPVG